MGAVKVMYGRDKRDRTAAGKGWQQGNAASAKSVNNCRMTKVLDYGPGAGGGNKDKGMMMISAGWAA
jgi:hypothetical protein